MAPVNRPSALAKLKTQDCVSPEADSFNVTGSNPVLPLLAAFQSTLKLKTGADSEKCPDLLMGNEEDGEKCQTPKLGERKISPAVCCPPAPIKRRSILVKRKLPANPIEGFYILSDSDLQSLFGTDLAKRKVISKSPKQKNLQNTVKESGVHKHINMSKKFEEVQAHPARPFQVVDVKCSSWGRNR